MLGVKRHTSFSLIGRAMIGTAAATLLAISFALTISARDKTEASKLPEVRNRQQEVRNLRQGTGQTERAKQSRDNTKVAQADSMPTILYKETARYTDEAKRNRPEGRGILGALVE